MSALKYLKVLPKHIKESNSELVRFLEEYYTWLESNQVIFDYVNKEERTSLDDDELLKYIRAEILVNFPELQVDEQLLLKHIKEFYISKGTENSILFLIKILFGINASVFLPSDNLFIPSAAKFKRETAIRFQLTSGEVTNSFSVIGYTLDAAGIKHPLELTFIKKLHDDIYEAVINARTIVPGVLHTDAFEATLLKTVSVKNIRAPGVGFQVGDIFEINNSGGEGTIIKVTRVTPETGLRAFDIIRFGEGYLTNFTHVLYANTALDVARVNNLEITLDDGTATELFATSSNDNVNKLNDSVQVSRFTYFQSLDYLENNNYVGELVAAGSTDVTGVNYTNAEAALIDFKLDYAFTYPGYYVTNEGVPSDTSYLQDGEYWQQYSYVIKGPIQYEEYKDVIKKLTHPAGMRMFGEYTIEQRLNVLIDIHNYLSVINTLLTDRALIGNEVVEKTILKNVMYFDDSAQYTEAANIAEEVSKFYTKNVPDDLVSVSDQRVITFTKVTEEQPTFSDNTVVKNVGKNINDEQVGLNDSLQKVFYKEALGLAPFGLVSDFELNNILMSNSGTTLDVGVGNDLSTLGDPNLLAINNVDFTTLVDLASDIERINVTSFGGVIMNPYYSTVDLLTYSQPYWAYGYTQNERAFN